MFKIIQLCNKEKPNSTAYISVRYNKAFIDFEKEREREKEM